MAKDILLTMSGRWRIPSDEEIAADEHPGLQDQMQREILRLLNRGHAVKLTMNGAEILTMHPGGSVTYPDSPGYVIERPR